MARRHPSSRNPRNQRDLGSREQRRRTLGQNFLHDRDAIQRIVRAAHLSPTGLLVEVGAGDGRLTAALAPHAGRILAYEIDPAHAARLRARCHGLDNVQCVLGDFLAAAPPREPFAVVGNIPYAATSRIVAWCLRAPRLTAATLLTQREYARKRTGDYGRWTQVTVESWPRFDWRLAGRVGRESFYPVPAVDSAILRLTRRDRDLLPAAALGPYRRFVAQGFSGVGGSLHASLRHDHPRRALDAAFRAAGLAPGTAVGFVHPDQWITLFRRLHPHFHPHFPPAGR